MHYTWNRTRALEQGEEVGVLGRHIVPPVHLLSPDSAASPSQHSRGAQPGRGPEAANLPLLEAR